MNSSTRVIVNTTAQYAKTFVNIILTLFSARLILEALGVTDFGLYSLLAGVTSMLAFATNALASTTQRFLSYHQGKSCIEQQKDIFANSFYIQLSLGLLTLVVLLALTPFLFDGILNVPTERVEAAQWTYVIVAIILFVTFLCTPYRAILISHENIVYITIIDNLVEMPRGQNNKLKFYNKGKSIARNVTFEIPSDSENYIQLLMPKIICHIPSYYLNKVLK